MGRAREEVAHQHLLRSSSLGMILTSTVVEGHLSVSLERAKSVGNDWLVDRELLVVDSDAVSVSIGVGEEAGLEDRVGRGLDTGNEVGRVEGDLLNLSEVVLDVAVENELSEFAKRVVGMRPNLGQVEDVDVGLLGLLGSHGLNVGLPLGEVTALDGLEEVLRGVVGGRSGELTGLLSGKEFDTLLRQHVNLAVDPVALLVDHLEGVSGVSLHLAVAVRNTTISEEPHDLVDRLGVLGEVVPEVGSILSTSQVSLRVSLLGVDEVRELRGVAEEEDRGVVEDPVHVAFLGLQLDGEATGVTSGIGGSGLATNFNHKGKSA